MYSWGSLFGDGDKVQGVLDLADDAYPGRVESDWGEYLTDLMQGRPRVLAFNCNMFGATPRFLLPPAYRELRISDFSLLSLRAYVGRGCDGKPEEWIKMQKYAVSQLANEGMFAYDNRHRARAEVRGCLLLLIFGTRAKVYYCMTQHGMDQMKRSGLQIDMAAAAAAFASAASVSSGANENPDDAMNGLVQLIPGDEPFDVRDSNARTKLEDILSLFRSAYLEGKEYFPIGKEKLPVIKLEKEEEEDEGEDTVEM